MIGDLNGKPHIVVQFTIGAGAGNAHYHYLLVLKRSKLKKVGLLRIGGRGFREITIKKIEEGFIRAGVMWYGPNDSLSSPSVHGETSFCIDFGGLVECDTVIGKGNN